MNVIHIGDAYDVWKGAVLNAIREKTKMHIGVIPMFTGSWKSSDINKYADILRVGIKGIACTGLYTNTQSSRKNYFDNVAGRMHSPDGLFFLDPDTGIEPGSRAGVEHLRIDDLEKLLNKSNVVGVYQHNNRKSNGNEKWLCVIGKRVCGKTPGRKIKYLAYDCSTVGMLFFSQNAAQLSRIKKSIAPLTVSWKLAQY